MQFACDRYIDRQESTIQGIFFLQTAIRFIFLLMLFPRVSLLFVSFSLCQIVQKLLNAGADIDLKDDEEKLPIHMATEYVH